MNSSTADDGGPGRHPPSYYAASARGLVEHPRLDGGASADLCIVGGGYTGLSAALCAAERGLDVMVVEANRMGWGASGRNGGQVGPGLRVDQTRLEALVGRATARRLWDMGEEARRLVLDLVARHRIDCDWRPGLMHLDHRRRHARRTRAHVNKLRGEYGYDAIRVVDPDEARALVAAKGYFGGTFDGGGGHLHPLNLALGLARAAARAGARLFENTRVVELDAADPVRVRTTSGTVRARSALIACNGYLGRLNASVAARVMPIDNFIIATEPLGADRAGALIASGAAVADSRHVVNYFRLSPDNRLLFGGGETCGRFPKDIRAFVRPAMLRIFPQLADAGIDHGWGGTLAVTVTRLPHLARLGPNLLSASGYSGHGVAMATLCGRLAAEALMDDGRGASTGFDLLAGAPAPKFPGGSLLRAPLLALAMAWYGLRDRF